MEFSDVIVTRNAGDEPFPPLLESSGINDGLDRWRDALETILFRHGTDELRTVLNEIYS